MAEGPNPGPKAGDAPASAASSDALEAIKREIAEARQLIARGTEKIEEALKHVG